MAVVQTTFNPSLTVSREIFEQDEQTWSCDLGWDASNVFTAYPGHSGVYLLAIDSIAVKYDWTKPSGQSLGGSWGEFNIFKNGVQVTSCRWENQGGTQGPFSNSCVVMVQLKNGDKLEVRNYVGQANVGIQTNGSRVTFYLKEI